MHQIIKDLSARYTVKQYDPSKRISAENIDIIKEAMRLSPSSINSQPWKFIVIESDQAKKRFHTTFANKHQFNQHHAEKASHIVLFAYDPSYIKDTYKHVLDIEVKAGRLSEQMYDTRLNVGFSFAELNTDDAGFNGHWTKAQLYLALGNTMHTLARLEIGSTPMEGVDVDMIAQEFKTELNGFVCEVALAMGYYQQGKDLNHDLPKSRLPIEEVVTVL